MKAGDIIENDGCFEIIVSVGENGIEKIPLKEHVMRCYNINHNGNSISIAELVDDLMNEVINKTTNQ